LINNNFRLAFSLLDGIIIVDLKIKKECNMKKKDIIIGKTYVVKVSNKLAPVRITAENPLGGYNGVNTRTGRTIHIRGVQRIRRLWPADLGAALDRIMK